MAYPVLLSTATLTVAASASRYALAALTASSTLTASASVVFLSDPVPTRRAYGARTVYVTRNWMERDTSTQKPRRGSTFAG
jgi:hypothetical protein